MFGVKNNIRSHNVGSPSEIARDCALYGNLERADKVKNKLFQFLHFADDYKLITAVKCFSDVEKLALSGEPKEEHGTRTLEH